MFLPRSAIFAIGIMAFSPKLASSQIAENPALKNDVNFNKLSTRLYNIMKQQYIVSNKEGSLAQTKEWRSLLDWEDKFKNPKDRLNFEGKQSEKKDLSVLQQAVFVEGNPLFSSHKVLRVKIKDFRDQLFMQQQQGRTEYINGLYRIAFNEFYKTKCLKP